MNIPATKANAVLSNPWLLLKELKLQAHQIEDKKINPHITPKNIYS